ncbi:uncharacterized protein LOC5511679 [Nematostella vectensis]|uniref:uncharacterized protein LOC5511679 n=1 Tax=Nematostella vectensis TaxID=45351 RepID=UPI0020777DA3|nr:uncharacterized protein LOC5511679 [Nematostella vectensis]
MKQVVFYYDVVCPFAFMASKFIEGLAKQTQAEIVWKPVLLGGLYKAISGEGDYSAADKMCDARKLIVGQDLRRLLYRSGLDVHMPSGPPKKTLPTMRLLAAACVQAQETGISLTHWLYDAYWVHNKDVTSLDVLQEGASHVGWSVDVESTINGVGKQVLLDNTQEALDRGAFGVPSFWVNNELFYGTDRMHFVESALGPDKHVTMPRLYHPPSHPTRAKLIIYHDFASPWSYLGSTQIADLVSSLHPVSVEVEWVPILVGALFKAIGTPVVPMQSVGDSKRQYFMKDLSRYSDYLSVPLKWTSHFPLRTILPARLTIANNDDRLRHALYEAAWRYDKNIGDEQVVREILTNAGYDARALIAATKSPMVKDQLKANTERAIAAGACGVPSYQVNDGPVLWGQDRLNIVADMLCGWQDQPQQDNGPSSKL